MQYDQFEVSGVTVVAAKENEMVTGKQYKEIPPTWQGQKWTRKLLHQMSTAELKRVLDLYGHASIDAQCAITAARAAGGQQ